MVDHCLRQVDFYVNKARALGYVITVHNQPLEPFSMGNHESVVEVRPAHSTYRHQE